MERFTGTGADPNANGTGLSGYRDYNSSTGTAGSIPDAAALNSIQEELCNLATATGNPLNGADNTQVVTAVQELIEARSGNYLTDTGIAGAYVVALSPAITAYAAGLTIRVKVINSNTGASTLDAGAGPEPWNRDDGAAMQAGDLPAGGIATAVWDAASTSWRLGALVPSQLGALAKLGVGAGLINDGAGNAAVGRVAQPTFAPVSAKAGYTLAPSTTYTQTVSFTPPANGWAIVLGFVNLTQELASASSVELVLNGGVIAGDQSPVPASLVEIASVSAGEACTASIEYTTGSTLSGGSNSQAVTVFFIPEQ